MAVTEEQVMQVLGRSPALNKPNAREVITRLVNEANLQQVTDDSRILRVVNKVVKQLVDDEDCCQSTKCTMRGSLNPPVTYKLSGSYWGNHHKSSNQENLY